MGRNGLEGGRMITIEEQETERLYELKGKLRACPFCGKMDALTIFTNPQTLYASVCCNACKVKMSKSFKGDNRIRDLIEDLMIESWNTRAEEEE